MTDFNELLKKGWGEIPERKLLPVGSWLLKCLSITFAPAKKEGNSPQVAALFQPKEAMEDVDPTELAALLDGDYDIAQNKIGYRIWMEDASSLKKVEKLLTQLGVDMTGLTVEESFKKARGHEISGYVTQRAYKANDGTDATSNDITEFAPL